MTCVAEEDRRTGHSTDFEIKDVCVQSGEKNQLLWYAGDIVMGFEQTKHDHIVEIKTQMIYRIVKYTENVKVNK